MQHLLHSDSGGKMRRAAILINAYSRLEHSLYQSQRIKQELEACGVRADVLRNDFFAALIEEDGGIFNKMSGYAFCVYLDKDKYVSDMLEKCGMRLFNRHDAIVGCDDKMTTYITLSRHGIPMPLTLPGLLCYDVEESVKTETLNEVAERLGFPLIVKTSYGSLGNGVFKAEDMTELSRVAEQLKCMPHLFQRYIASSYGRDIRVIVIGGKYFGAIERRSKGDFRSNLEMGGTAVAIEPPRHVTDMCERIAEIMGLDYCGIDILYGEEEGSYYVCEVNSNAFFCGFEAATGKNVARRYCEHMLAEIYA